MSRKTSLMEWLEQTKRMSKMVDYLTMDTIDSVLKHMWFIEPRVLKKHQKLITKICLQYHKPNPIELIKNKEAVSEHFKSLYGMDFEGWVHYNVKNKNCTVYTTKVLKKCPVSKLGVKTFSDFVDSSLSRCASGRKNVLWQWFEVIDFMYERPELIDEKLVDPYIEEKITEVCAGHRKNNPLTNGHRKKFGKQWFDKEEGKWKIEKRRRFN